MPQKPFYLGLEKYVNSAYAVTYLTYNGSAVGDRSMGCGSQYVIAAVCDPTAKQSVAAFSMSDAYDKADRQPLI